MLATIYQRLDDVVRASHACRRVLENPEAPPAKRADALSQLARNEKAAWVKDFARLEIQDAQQQAISDQRLIDALEGYRAGSPKISTTTIQASMPSVSSSRSTDWRSRSRMAG